MNRPALWLYLLAAITILVIALRRLKLRIRPLDDELYSKKVAIDHVLSGAAWVQPDGKIGWMNLAFAAAIGCNRDDLTGADWYTLFPQKERARVSETYSQMLLSGMASLDTRIERPDGTIAPTTVVLVAIHDHRMRFVGHHCLTHDISREKNLEQKVKELTAELARLQAVAH